MKFDLAIIGGGPGGYTAAERAAEGGLSVVLFEKKALGGVCLNEGCVPTKTLLYSAKVYNTVQGSKKYGIEAEAPTFDLSRIITRKKKIVKKLTAGIRMKMEEGGVEVRNVEVKKLEQTGTGFSVVSDEETIEAAKVIVCTGSETVIPPIPGLKDVAYWTSREALESKELPQSLTVIGGGVIGMEFASFFNSLGCKVTVVEMLDEILGGMDKELSAQLREEYTKRGVEFYLKHKVVSVEEGKIQVEAPEGNLFDIAGEKVLLSVGRRPVTKVLEGLSYEPFGRGVKVNEFMQTSILGLYAIGDITGFSLLAHTAVREAEVAVHHILGQTEDKMSYRAIPGVVYTNPEIAGVGATEESLKKEGVGYSVLRLPMAFSGRFVAENEQVNGVCKLIVGENNQILGVHLLGNPSSELVVIAGIAIEQRMTLDQFRKFVFPHPTVAEILREATFA